MLHALFISLTWWQVGLLVIYIIYTICRAIWIYRDGLRDTMLEYNERTVKLYHVIWAIIDIPAILLGKFFPVLSKIFNIPIFQLKERKKD